MGQMLQKPVESTIVERKAKKGFRVGMAELNGWRNKMEDAHVIHFDNDWAFFGVFDGHGGDQCSTFVAKEWYDRLQRQGCPQDDAAFRKTVFSIDEAFLYRQEASGSTATMCVVNKPATRGGRIRLRVVNAGDSRAILGRRDGSIIDGGGTDQGLTTDHKPSHPVERQRIYRCGGHVEEAAGGVARVNGELAVSRGFGDAQYKKTGGPLPEDRPVTADPEFGHFDCSENDFLMIVCDGVSEGDFPNPEVVKFAARCLAEKDDPGAAARAVCLKAVEANSKDNVTCMIILFNGADREESTMEFIPGPVGCLSKSFIDAYEAMAKRASLTLAQAIEMRYDAISSEIAAPGTKKERLASLQEEANSIGVPSGAKGSIERSKWFQDWADKLPTQEVDGGIGARDPDMGLLDMLMARPGGEAILSSLLARGGSGPQQVEEDGRRVCVADIATLRRAVDQHPVLKWDDRMATLANAEGIVKQEDTSDGTMNVRFAPPLGILAWLPTSVLTTTEEASIDSRARPAGIGGRPRLLQGAAGASVGSSIASNLLGARRERENLSGFGRRSGLQSGIGSGRGATPVTGVAGRSTSPAGLPGQGTLPATPTDAGLDARSRLDRLNRSQGRAYGQKSMHEHIISARRQLIQSKSDSGNPINPARVPNFPNK